MDVIETIIASVSDLESRLITLWEQTGDERLRTLANCSSIDGNGRRSTAQERHDRLCTTLMDSYKNSGAADAFALLYELNRHSFTQTIQSKLRRSMGHVDCHDVLQEVFLNIYRYPHNFHADRDDAFRNWGYRIVRNTLLKFLKTENRTLRHASIDYDEFEWEDTHARTPVRAAQDAEGAIAVDWAYLVYLNLYLVHFHRLSAKEQKALTMVEVDGASYREAADTLGIRLENLKMVIFRGRRKVFRGLNRTLQEIACLSTPPAQATARAPQRITTLSAS